MKPNRSEKHYAQALWSVAEKAGKVDDVKASLFAFADLVVAESVFRAFVNTVKISTDDKMQILTEMFQGRIHVIVLELLKLLDESRHSSLIGKITEEFKRLDKEKSNLVSVSVFTHTALGDDETRLIHNLLEAATGKTVDLSSEVDSSLLGGIKMRIGNTFLDGTVASQMEKLRRNLISE